jgi:hypothetical protein
MGKRERRDGAGKASRLDRLSVRRAGSRQSVIAVEQADDLDQGLDRFEIAELEGIIDHSQRPCQPRHLQTDVAIGRVEGALVDRLVDFTPNGRETHAQFLCDQLALVTRNDEFQHDLVPLRFCGSPLLGEDT